MKIKKFVKNLPLLGAAAKYFYKAMLKDEKLNDSREYWERRYAKGGTSGDGSYKKLAEFKSEYINNFVVRNGINSVIEYGVGDGNQLTLAEYPSYIGFDVSVNALERCRKLFNNDENKLFILVDEYSGERADLTLSLDVIYHLVEDDVFETYMSRLFSSSDRFVIIYSSNATDLDYANKAPHVRHRVFTKWVEANMSNWQLIEHKENKYPYVPGDNAAGSFADFYVYSSGTPRL
jgi:hypothetical protein